MDGREDHTATLLPNGIVLVVGGHSPVGNYLASTELYDPSTGAFTSAAAMLTGHTGHAVALLADGKVLITGGIGGANTSAELYDPTTGAFAPTGDMLGGRYDHAALVLPDGKVLVTGGRRSN